MREAIDGAGGPAALPRKCLSRPSTSVLHVKPGVKSRRSVGSRQGEADIYVYEISDVLVLKA